MEFYNTSSNWTTLGIVLSYHKWCPSTPDNTILNETEIEIHIIELGWAFDIYVYVNVYEQAVQTSWSDWCSYLHWLQLWVNSIDLRQSWPCRLTDWLQIRQMVSFLTFMESSGTSGKVWAIFTHQMCPWWSM